MDLSSRRKKRYLQHRMEYSVALDYFCKDKGVAIQDTTPFSAMDDNKGYNVSPTEPSSTYITDMFKALADEHKEVIEAAFDDQPPCSVISLDHTFNGSKRTCEFVPSQPPENLPPGAQCHSSYAAVEKNALLIAIGADGKVCSLLLTLFTSTSTTTKVIHYSSHYL